MNIYSQAITDYLLTLDLQEEYILLLYAQLEAYRISVNARKYDADIRLRLAYNNIAPSIIPKPEWSIFKELVTTEMLFIESRLERRNITIIKGDLDAN